MTKQISTVQGCHELFNYSNSFDRIVVFGICICSFSGFRILFQLFKQSQSFNNLIILETAELTYLEELPLVRANLSLHLVDIVCNLLLTGKNLLNFSIFQTTFDKFKAQIFPPVFKGLQIQSFKCILITVVTVFQNNFEGRPLNSLYITFISLSQAAVPDNCRLLKLSPNL